MRVGVLFSGGKDSTFALFLAKKEHNIVCLINIRPENQESYMFHSINSEFTELQAKAMGLPLIIQTTKGKKEEELKELKLAIKKAIKEFKIEGIVTGAVKSIYQSSRVQKICNKLNLYCFNPLWQNDEENLLNEIIKNNFEVIIVGVFAYPLGKEWLGKKIDKNTIKELLFLRDKYKISPAGEGGEIETFVLNAPIFKKRIEIKDYEIQYKNNSGVFKIKNAILKRK